MGFYGTGTVPGINTVPTAVPVKRSTVHSRALCVRWPVPRPAAHRRRIVRPEVEAWTGTSRVGKALQRGRCLSAKPRACREKLAWLSHCLSPQLEQSSMPTVAELKAELRKHGLATSGLKDTLKQRLAEHQAASRGGSAPSSRPTSPESSSPPDSPSIPNMPEMQLEKKAPLASRTRTPSSLIGLMHRQRSAALLTHEEKSRREQLRVYSESMYQQRQQSLGSVGSPRTRKITKFKLIKMFEDIDEDGNGTLDKDEIKTLLCKIKGSQTVSDGELASLMNELNPSGTGEVTQTEFLDYFECTRDTGAGIIGKYLARKVQKQSPTVCARIDKQVRQYVTWIYKRAMLPFKVVLAATAAFFYWTLVSSHAYEDAIAKWTMLLPLSWITARLSIETVGRGFREMTATLSQCKGDAFSGPAVGGHDVLRELEMHAGLFLNRTKCSDRAFQFSMTIGQSTGVLSVPMAAANDHVIWLSPVLAFRGMGIVECSILIGILQICLLALLLRLVGHLCAATYSKAVGTELWGKLRDAHFESTCQSMFDQLDLNGDGKISRTELATAFQTSTFQPPVSGAELDNIIDHADVNGNGFIEYAEFRPVWYATRGSEVLPGLKQAFTAFDNDENGFASITEFRDVMRQLNEPYNCEPTDEDLRAMAELADVDTDGQVDYEEFVKMMLNYPNAKEYLPMVSVLKWLRPKLQMCKWIALWVWVVLSMTPPIIWLEKLISICSQFERESINIADGLNELLQHFLGSRGASDFSCEYRTFGFQIVSLVKWVVVDLYEGISSVGIFGAICGLPTAYEMWNAHQMQLAEEKEQQQQNAATLERDFMEIVQFSLCRIQQGEFSYTTMFEMKLKELVKGKKVVLEAVNHAAEKTTKQYALLHTLDKKDWEQVRGMILNTLSERYSDGYVAEELGMGAQKAKFWFCLVNEKSGGTTKKLRVIVARDTMLKEVQTYMKNGTEPTYDIKRFKSRWDTVKNMAILLSERSTWKNSPMRDIELGLPSHMRA